MAASPFPPTAGEAAGPLAGLAWVWSWVWPALSSAFGAGAVWGVTRSTAADHDRRLTRLEDSVPAVLQSIGEKIDENHREVMRMIVNLAHNKPGG